MTEKPLPSNNYVLFRITNASKRSQKLAVLRVIDEFFFLTPAGYSNDRFEEELTKAESRRTKAQKGANSRWKNHAPSNAPSNATGNAPHHAIHTHTLNTNTKTSLPSASVSDNRAAAAVQESAAAAAIKSVFDVLQTNPFGSRAFQRTFVVESKNGAKSWVDVMEHTIQTCKARKILIPRRFYTIKHVLEKLDAEQSFKRTPL
jgi:uncharacterized protein YdaU (DUF1376 family)